MTEIIRIQNLHQILDHVNDLEVVVFDLDDTLYDEIEYVKSGFKAIARDLLREIPNAYQELLLANELRLPAIDYVLDKFKIENKELRDQCIELYRTHEPDICLPTESRDVLNALVSKGLKLGIITDGRPDGQRAKLEALGLEAFFQKIIITDELGGISYRKPCDLAFRKMKSFFNVPYEKMCYVGDNVGKDFFAPQVLGMRSVLFENARGLYCVRS